ncbi:methyltransferase domain-containing protein [Pacificimonas sp. WHA3]|uniref:Methyltransferase domain-containing protein n=1 Tax=Pacificimonas pallii TaxID=2827236 RepID=A0ABS6SHD4_9SPHN|nr:methyltransferase domain-containing protein [Pacificimonas pallii]MBV7257829.1 methyltransferase domain-containing protein [Pacificimonas pallii]
MITPDPAAQASIAEPFDRAARRAARNRCAGDFADFAFLKHHMAGDLAARAAGFERRWSRVLDLGAHDGSASAMVPSEETIRCDCAAGFSPQVICDEDRLPFAAAQFDLVLSAGSLNGVNDLPGALVQIRQCLRPDGIFLASFVGGASLADQRQALIAADLAASDGASPRLHPMIDGREAPSLLQRAGFADPVVDIAETVVHYRDPLAMRRDLRGMGEGNYLRARARRPIGRTRLKAMTEHLETLRDDTGRIAAHLEIVTMTGRVPAKG